MAEKMIKVLLFTYGRQAHNPLYHEGGDQPETIVVEGLARLGEVVDITRDYDLERGERLGAFFTDEERKQVEEGSYKGVDSPTVYASRLGEARRAIEPADGEGTVDVNELSAEELADYIVEHKLNAQKTADLAGDDEDSINKVLDAEGLAMQQKDAEPRQVVVKQLEAKLALATQGS